MADDDLDEDSSSSGLEERIVRTLAGIEKRLAPPPPDRAKMTVAQKTEYIRQHGMERYLLLPMGKR